MDFWSAVILGIVEGLTEYLPVSSTGHLILMSHWLGHADDAAKSFDIVIQLGAILAVVVHFREVLRIRGRAFLSREPGSARPLLALGIAFVPAAITGLLFGSIIKQHLFGPVPVALALAVGGALMLASDLWTKRRAVIPDEGLDAVSLNRAFWIGIGQCFALWPGASRSMCTIVAGQLSGLSTRTAAEFSFLLALPTLGAATMYEGIKSRAHLIEGIGLANIAVGLVVSFFVAWAVIAVFLRYLNRYGLAPFAYYRFGLALLVLWVNA